MKLYSIFVLYKSTKADKPPVILSKAINNGAFFFYMRATAQETMTFAGRMITERTERGKMQLIHHLNKDCHCLVLPSGLACVVTTDEDYPPQVLFLSLSLSLHFSSLSFSFSVSLSFFISCTNLFLNQAAFGLARKCVNTFALKQQREWEKEEKDLLLEGEWLQQMVVDAQDPKKADVIYKIMVLLINIYYLFNIL